MPLKSSTRRCDSALARTSSGTKLFASVQMFLLKHWHINIALCEGTYISIARLLPLSLTEEKVVASSGLFATAPSASFNFAMPKRPSRETSTTSSSSASDCPSVHDSAATNKTSFNCNCKISEPQSQRILKTYSSIFYKKWILASGDVVEGKMMQLASVSTFEHPVHSFFLVVQNEVVALSPQ
ncbi:hypothetical protein [Parasitella parasitica]|uniref:Uncharacterized protein n=1 Tax=Parasitella parasitica TaxID=35722 RepID=A0A0B7N9Z3_9FUNG|nr:hypothetical protein [Parasitella parasitica]